MPGTTVASVSDIHDARFEDLDTRLLYALLRLRVDVPLPCQTLFRNVLTRLTLKR